MNYVKKMLEDVQQSALLLHLVCVDKDKGALCAFEFLLRLLAELKLIGDIALSKKNT